MNDGTTRDHGEGVLAFDGEAFDPVGTPSIPAPSAPVAVVPKAARPAAFAQAPHRTVPVAGQHNPLRDIRIAVTEAHRAHLDAHTRVQHAILRAAGTAPAPLRSLTVAPVTVAAEGAFKPLARANRRTLDRAALESLSHGDVAAVFGMDYHQAEANPEVRVAADSPLVLTAITDIDVRGGALSHGRLRARFDGDATTAAVQAVETFAVYAGLHLCLVDATLTAAPPSRLETGSTELDVVVTQIDLVPRPHLTAEVIAGDGRSISVTVTVTEKPGSAIGPGTGGTLDHWTGRIGHGGERVLLNEFHMAHLAHGDQGIALGPEFAHFTGHRSTRLPTGGLLLVDRISRFDGTRGVLDSSASYDSEYDSPADSWYYADSANNSVPHFVYMETSLQAALLMGLYVGPTLTAPDQTLSLRNLGGTATVLRQVDLRDKTIAQSSRLLSTTMLPGSSLQTFDYTLSVDGEAFYRGETMFGYFSDEALGNQTGLDAGRTKPTWRETNVSSAVRTIDIAARRNASGARLCSRGTLALLDQIDVVDGGGDHGVGYLHAVRRIDPDDWFFARHFHLDPVIPGSLGVETAIQAVQEWMLDAGFDSGMADPQFMIPADIDFTWKYRGQFLPTDRQCELEVHIKTVERRTDSVIVTVDASLWKPGLRIYELTDLAVELADNPTPNGALA
ncbi:beta-ketoacyl synthase [Rhodococcus sp. H29-C3]|uniref:beta-ketoacyl synthase n=1 Tax=Rhodococcus sp. H29-C3 TaxID=3046307 RepID=UPI0024BBE72A|nr:beta-ketoacyl synthase [Rhodococcus sp. H29-C3]MDJ0362805.1 beta-ketoacyl synthase [Rhodococcus sp. H29-C3]